MERKVEEEERERNHLWNKIEESPQEEKLSGRNVEDAMTIGGTVRDEDSTGR